MDRVVWAGIPLALFSGGGGAVSSNLPVSQEFNPEQPSMSPVPDVPQGADAEDNDIPGESEHDEIMQALLEEMACRSEVMSCSGERDTAADDAVDMDMDSLTLHELAVMGLDGLRPRPPPAAAAPLPPVPSPVDESTSAPSGLMRVRSQNPDSFEWGTGFRFTWSPPSKRPPFGSWQCLCRFHKKSHVTMCTRSMNVPSGDQEAKDKIRRLLKLWALQAPKHKRKFTHGNVSVAWSDDMSEELLDAKAALLPAPPYNVMPDDELDALDDDEELAGADHASEGPGPGPGPGPGQDPPSRAKRRRLPKAKAKPKSLAKAKSKSKSKSMPKPKKKPKARTSRTSNNAAASNSVSMPPVDEAASDPKSDGSDALSTSSSSDSESSSSSSSSSTSSSSALDAQSS